MAIRHAAHASIATVAPVTAEWISPRAATGATSPQRKQIPGAQM
jgi:hypothetical protein